MREINENVEAVHKCNLKNNKKRKIEINKKAFNVDVNKINNNVGITLIALIVTIIVLLILAGVTLNMVIGEDGIINKAQIARNKTNQAQENEENDINNLENKMNETLQRQNGSSKFEVLWENTERTPIEVGKEFELKEEFTNYDVLSVNCRLVKEYGVFEVSINTKDLKNIVDEDLSTQNPFQWCCDCVQNHYLYINFSKDYKKWYVKLIPTAAPYLINSITGIKF